MQLKKYIGTQLATMKGKKLNSKCKKEKEDGQVKNYNKKLYSDFGLFVCGQCGRFLKADDLPCACGNDDELKEFFYTPTGFESPDFKGRHDVNRGTDVYIT